MVKKEISSVHNGKEAFWETALWCVTSTHWITAVFRGAVCYPYFCGIWELIFWIPLKTIGPKEICSDQNEKEAFWETSLWSVNSSHRVTALPQEAFRSECSCGICKVIFGSPWSAMVKREISSDKNRKEAFLETAFCSVNSSHRVTTFSPKEPFAKTVLVLFAKWYLEAHGGL